MSAEKMFASRNTDGNERSWSKINKRWSESLADLIEYSNFQLYSDQTILYIPRLLQVQKVQLISLVQQKPSLTSLIPFVHRSKGFGCCKNGLKLAGERYKALESKENRWGKKEGDKKLN